MTAGRREHSPEPPAPERSGPLIAERHRKADGRLLVLYRRADEDERDVGRAELDPRGGA